MKAKSHNKIIGEWGERLAEEFLARRGYSIVGKNIKTSYKEIDLVCRHGSVLVFVEVKTRTSLVFGSAIDMVGQKKIKNLKQAALNYLATQKPKYGTIRIDFVAIDVDKINNSAKIKHYKDIV